MAESLLAYFKSENDAESAKASLQRLPVKNLYVDQMTEAGDYTTFIPLFPMGSTSYSSAVSGDLDGSGVVANEVVNKEEDDPITHMLEVQVEDADYEEAKGILRENRAYSKKE